MYLQSHIYKNIPVSFDFITTWNQGIFLYSPCIKVKHKYTYTNQLQSRFITTPGPTTNLWKVLKFMFPPYCMEFHQYQIQFKQELLRM